MSRLQWYSQRLRSMSPAELAWRVGRLAKTRSPLRRRGLPDDSVLLGPDTDWADALDRFRSEGSRPIVLDRSVAEVIAADRDMVDRLLNAADRVAEYRFQFFGYPEVSLPRPVDWSFDPVGRVGWPRVAASKIDHRTAEGDVKWIWELNRLQHLPWLAEAWLITGEKRYSEAAFTQIDSWIEQNPPGRGIAWRGSFEAGIRAISVAIAVQCLRHSPDLTVDRYRRIVSMLAASGTYCWAERSRFSSANNHLIGELAGLATIAILFPELPKAATWERRAVADLAREADLQILADGVGAEQAVGYQIFTAELLMVVAVLLRRRDGRAPDKIVAAVERGAHFLAAVVGEEDPAPRFGDDDEGFALRLGPEPTRTVRDHLAIVGAFTGSPSLRALGRPNLTAAWLSERDGDDVRAGEKFEAGSLYAEQGGLAVLRSGRRRLTMDVAPLGYLSIAAHGHADALSLTLAVDGAELIGDPGAGSYYGNPDWRPVHRGTRAHGTVEVDGVDQSVIGGAFMWTSHAHTTVRAVDLARGIVDAEHDGYARLSNPAVHRRWLVAPPGEQEILVVDLVTGSGPRSARTSWPLHPSLRAVVDPHGHTVYRGEDSVLQIVHASNGDVAAEHVVGDAGSGFGWWSDRLESRTPSAWVGAEVSHSGPIVVATVLNPISGDAPAASELHVAGTDRAIEVMWRLGTDQHAVSIDTTGSAAVTWRSKETFTQHMHSSDDQQANEVS